MSDAGVRSLAKQVVEHALEWSGTSRAARWLHRHRTLVLAYHNILPPGESPGSDEALHLTLESFEAQLEVLVELADVVPLAEVLAPNAPQSDRPRVAITFDDAYRGAVTVGVAALARRRLPGTIFVTPGMLGGRSFWWDSLATTGSTPTLWTMRAHALTALAGRDEQVRTWAEQQGHRLTEPGPACRTATLGELHAATAHGIRLGAHTWNHPNLAALPGDELAGELTRPLSWLREKFRDYLPILAYPYGLETDAVRLAAREAGYTAGFRVSGGWLPSGPGSDPLGLPRLNVPAGLSVRGFALRISGLLAR